MWSNSVSRPLAGLLIAVSSCLLVCEPVANVGRRTLGATPETQAARGTNHVISPGTNTREG